MSEEAKQNRQWILKQYPKGLPTTDDVVLETSPIPELKDGEVLVRNHYISVDPYQRGQMMPAEQRAYTAGKVGIGFPVVGGGIGSVVKSNDDEFPVGALVTGSFGWVEYAAGNAKELGLFKVSPQLPKLSYAQGILGMPGATAYFGTHRLLEPKAGKTLFVSGAAGAVGSIVGQIGKIEGMRVVGSAGSQEKLDYLKELGFDAVLNYKGKDAQALIAEIKQLVPEGIDAYFDNTGGPVSDAVVTNMNQFGRVAVCGQISSYNNMVLPKAPLFLMLLTKQIRAEGFMVMRWAKEWPEAMAYIAKHIGTGQLKPRETVTEGFENTLDAFLGLFKGANFGKQIVHISDPERPKL